MYKAFFHLKRNPFDLTSDPHCFVPTLPAQWGGARGALLWRCAGIKDSSWSPAKWVQGRPCCFGVFLRLLENSKDIAYAYLFNSRLSPTDLLQYVLSDFWGLPASGKNKWLKTLLGWI